MRRYFPMHAGVRSRRRKVDIHFCRTHHQQIPEWQTTCWDFLAQPGECDKVRATVFYREV